MTNTTTPWAIMAPVQGRIRVAMALGVLGALAGLAALGLLALALDTLLRHPGHWPWPALAGALACTVAAYGLRLQSQNRAHFAAFRLETVLRTDLSAHLATLPLGQVQQLGAGALSKILQDDVKALHVFVADSTPLYARGYALPLLTLGLLLWLDWRLALAAVAVLLVGLGVLSLAMRNRTEMVKRYNEARERVSAAVVEFVQAMPVVRSFDTGRLSFGRYQRALDDYLAVVTAWYRGAGFAARFSMAALNPLPTLVVLLWLGAWLYAREALDFSTWVAVLLLGSGMAEAMMPLMMVAHLVDKAKLSIARIQQLQALPSLPEPPVSLQPVDASVVFDAVSFRYGEGEGEALNEVSFTAAPGTVTALVGPSGAGKSTVARLIPRFWDVTAGRVLVGGCDVREMSSDTLMRHVAFVFQETFLFSGSIADNIRLGCPQASMADVIAAARAAQAHDFIQALPLGYETLAGERGQLLSGGQRQRITIARALLQDRPILVLDEATAFADPENERALMDALAVLMRGRTVLMVAHRLSTIREADQILVFSGGQLVERGRHAELLDRQARYARLWRDFENARDWVLPSHRATSNKEAQA